MPFCSSWMNGKMAHNSANTYNGRFKMTTPGLSKSSPASVEIVALLVTQCSHLELREKSQIHEKKRKIINIILVIKIN